MTKTASPIELDLDGFFKTEIKLLQKRSLVTIFQRIY